MVALVFVALLAQASPSLSPSPSATPAVLYALQPPAGWVQQPVANNLPGIYQMLGVFFGPSVAGFQTNINIIRDPLKNQAETMAERATETQAWFEQNGNHVTDTHQEKVCHGTVDGWYMESSGVLAGSETARVQTFLLSNDVEYVATYTRPIGTNPDAAALKSLDTLCPKP